MSNRQRLLFSLTSLLSLMAQGQVVRNDTVTDRTHQLREVIVTEKGKQQIVTSTAPLHIIDKDQMLSLGVTDVADALHRLPGVTIRDYGGAGGMKTVSVRGFGAKHTGVSYDGVMISDCQSGEIDLSRYSLENVDHLSLVVGDNEDIFIPAKNASTPALLNIQTLAMPTEDTNPHIVTQLKAGSFGYISPYLRYEQNITNRLAFSLSGDYTYAENDYPYELKGGAITRKDRRTNSRMNQGHAEINVLWKMGDYSTMAGKVYYFDTDRQLPGVVHYYSNLCKQSLREKNAFAQVQIQAYNQKGWSMKLHTKYNWNYSAYEDPLVPTNAYDASYWQRELYTSLAVMYTPNEKWAFDYSADYALNNLNSSSTQTINSHPYRHSLLQSGTARFKSDRLTVLGRLLHSLYLNYSKHGKSARNMRRFSPSLSFSYQLLEDEDLYVRASYKNIFRSPTFNESYYFHYGSPDLLPESTDQYNIGVTWGKKGDHMYVQLTADGYYNYVKDMIVAVPYNMFIWTCINVGRVRVLGADVTVDGSCDLDGGHKILLSGSYSYQKAENRTNEESEFYGNQIAYIPQHSGSIAIGWENPIVSVSLHGSGVSSRWDNNQHSEGSQIEGYWDTGVTAYHTFCWGGQKLEVRLDIKNILNKQYEIVHFYPMPGRSWQASVKYQL